MHPLELIKKFHSIHSLIRRRSPGTPRSLLVNMCLPFRYSISAIIALCIVTGSGILFSGSASDSAKHWVGTWACSPYMAQSQNKSPVSFDNYTVRQIVRVSIGGDTVRVKFSNSTCSTPVIIKSANIAVSPDGTKSAVTASTMTKLTFKGDSSVTIRAKGTAVSDPVAFNLKPSARIAITIFYGQCKSTDDMTFHYGSRTNSYYLSGDKTSSADFSGSSPIEKWFTICGIDVLAPKTAAAVVAFGNSITDGFGLTGGLQNRWTDAFSEKLLANPATAQVGVLNEGIGATLVTQASNGAAAGTQRFQPDVLDQAGVRWIIILYGVNDINAGVSSGTITNGYKTMITQAHAKNIKVYGGTLTPFKNSNYYSASNESTRNSINAWIRAAGNFDGVIEFDKAIQDPKDPAAMQASLSNGGLHPSDAGYKKMGECIDLKLFSDPTPVIAPKETKNQGYGLGEMSVNPKNGNTVVEYQTTDEGFVSLKVYSMLGKEIVELAGKKNSSGRHAVEFESKNLPKGMYLISMKAGGFSASKNLMLPIR